jgi:hypothetical protein
MYGVAFMLIGRVQGWAQMNGQDALFATHPEASAWCDAVVVGERGYSPTAVAVLPYPEEGA